jgi:hypothetical protein
MVPLGLGLQNRVFAPGDDPGHWFLWDRFNSSTPDRPKHAALVMVPAFSVKTL